MKRKKKRLCSQDRQVVMIRRLGLLNHIRVGGGQAVELR